MGDLRLSGWLPGDEHNGLSTLNDALAETFLETTPDGRSAATEVVVVGIVRGNSVKVGKGEDADTIEVKFHHIEPVSGPEADQVRAMLLRVADARRSVQSLPYPEGPDGTPEIPDSPADITKAPGRKRGRGNAPRFSGDSSSDGPGDA